MKKGTLSVGLILLIPVLLLLYSGLYTVRGVGAVRRHRVREASGGGQGRGPSLEDTVHPGPASLRQAHAGVRRKGHRDSHGGTRSSSSWIPSRGGASSIH